VFWKACMRTQTFWNKINADIKISNKVWMMQEKPDYLKNTPVMV